MLCMLLRVRKNWSSVRNRDHLYKRRFADEIDIWL